MLKKIFKFPSGYVIIEIVGKNKEKFINMCLANNFLIWDVLPSNSGLVCKIADSDFKQIRRLVRKSDVKVTIVSKHGINHIIKKNRYRFMLPVAGVLVCIYFLIMPQYIWCVEIDGTKNADTEKIYQILSDMGVYVGAKKSNIQDLGDIKNAVIFGEEEVNWAWLYIEGAKARLLVQERTRPPELESDEPQTIIASHDGFVRIAEVRRGERRVVAGDSVSKGDVLVSGKVAVFMEGYPEKYAYVNSDARIIADTVRNAKGTFDSSEILRIKTGNRKKRIGLELFGKEYFPIGRAESVFEDTDITVKNHDATLPIVGYLGFGINVYDVCEVNEVKNKLTEDEVLCRAKESLEEEIMKNVGIEAQKIDERLSYNKDGDKYTVKLTMDLRENIGIKIPQEE